MFEKIDHFLREDKFKLVIDENSVYLSNYKKLLSLEDNYISLLTPNKRIILKGKNLVLKKILDKELLVLGSIEKIEVQDE